MRARAMAISNTREPAINVTPLIDVLLVLLIIFMVVAPTRPARFEARIPGRPTGAPPSSDGPLVVELDRERTVTLGGEIVELGDLEARLAEALSGRTDRAVIVKAPRAVLYADVVEVIDRIEGAGPVPLGLQVDLLET